MKPVVQQEITGCAIACSAAIAGISYEEAKNIANRLGIFAEDESLWSGTEHILKLLRTLGVSTSNDTLPFKSWNSLPDRALLSIKWHKEGGKPYWHWVVFVREDIGEYVLDSKKSLKTNVRTDFNRMKPKWFIEIYK